MHYNPKINNLVNIAIESGLEVTEFETSGGICYFIKQSDTIYKFCIPDEIEMIDFETWKGILADSIVSLEVIGGVGLKSTAEMFRNVECEELNLSNFDTSSVRYMSYMFKDVTINNLNNK